jgi:general secretion pathway protein D
MRTLLATILLGPVLALAQVPARPPAPGAAPATRPPTATPPPPAARNAPPVAGPAAAATPPRPAEAAQAAPAGPQVAPPKTDAKCVPIRGRFMLSFAKADIVDVLEQASRWTCRNFIYGEDVAKGKITLLSKSPVTADEAYAAFLAALSSNGIALYQTGQYWKLVRTADAKKTPIPTYTTDGAATPATEQPITKLIRLKFADADQMRGIMGNFISPQGADLQAIPPDLLLLTDSGVNVRRIEKLIESIDKVGGGDLIKLVQIRYAPVKDIADKVNQIFGQAAGAPGKPGRRTVLSPAARPAPGVPQPGAPAPAAAGGNVEVQVTKVIADERTNKLIVISDEKSFDRIMDVVQQLDVPTAEGGGIHVIFLKNASAEDLATTLSNLSQGKSGKTTPGGGMPQPPGQPPGSRQAATAATASSAELFTGEVKITADKVQNALVVQASGADIVTVRRLIEKLDRPRRQVFIEAVIMEVNLNNSSVFGVGLHGAVPVTTKDGTGFIPIASSPGRINTVGVMGNVQSLISLGGFLTGFAGPTSASLKDLGLPIPNIGVMIQALQTSSDVNVLSTPTLLAADNSEAEISVGQTVPFQAAFAPSGLSSLVGNNTGTGNNNAALGAALGMGGLNSLYAPIQRQPVELRVKIKPQIGEGDNVKLLVDEQTEEIVSNDPQLGPTTAKRTVKSEIVARDQSTIVIGGLMQERTVRTVKKVPFLGSIPIIGWLFRDTSTNKQKTNLLLFLTPYIIRDESDYRRIYEKKRKDQQEFVEAFYGRQPDYDVAIDFARKTGPYGRLRREVLDETSKVENGGRGGPGDRIVTPGVPATGPAAIPLEAAPPVIPGSRPEPARPPEADGLEPIEPQPDLPEAAEPAPPAAPAPSAPTPPADLPPGVPQPVVPPPAVAPPVVPPSATEPQARPPGGPLPGGPTQ